MPKLIQPTNPSCFVHDVLKDIAKHLPVQPLLQDCLITEAQECPSFHPVIFDACTGLVIQSS